MQIKNLIQVFTKKKERYDKFDKYLIINTFNNKIIILKIVKLWILSI